MPSFKSIKYRKRKNFSKSESEGRGNELEYA